MPEWNLILPANTPELLHLIQQPGHQLIAGGTDLLPRLRRGTESSAPKLVDLSPLSALRFIHQQDEAIEIGALTTHAELAGSALLQAHAPALAEAAARIGSVQTRTRGTLGGNLANASPAADTLPPLLCLEAELTLTSLNGSRQVPLGEFLLGPGQTCLQAGEMISSIRFKLPQRKFGFVFSKLGRRNGMAIAVASLAVLLEADSKGHIERARIALGSLAPTAVRSPQAEAVLKGQAPSKELFARAAAAMQRDIAPISDLRASAAYRRHSAGVLLERALNRAWEQTESGCA